MAAETKNCPQCGKLILSVAKKCRYCMSYLDPDYRPLVKQYSTIERLATPENTPASAIISSYSALFAIVPLFGIPFGILAFFFGYKASRMLRNTPARSGLSRARFGLFVGLLSCLGHIAFFALVLIYEA